MYRSEVYTHTNTQCRSHVLLLSQCCASNKLLFFSNYYNTLKVFHQFAASVRLWENLIKKTHTHTHVMTGWSCSLKGGVFDCGVVPSRIRLWCAAVAREGNLVGRAPAAQCVSSGETEALLRFFVFACVCLVYCVCHGPSCLSSPSSSALRSSLSMIFLVSLPVSFLTCPVGVLSVLSCPVVHH